MLLSLQEIHKSFGPLQILKGVTLSLEPSQSIAIMGASGEGKSTLLHILGTLEPFDSGTLNLLSCPVTKANAPKMRNRHIGFVFQSFYLLEGYTALENVVMPARIAGRDLKEVYPQAHQLLERMGVDYCAHQKSDLLSGGEKQRVALARALCNDPAIILADEPSGNLDHKTAQEIHSLLLSLCKEEKKGMIVVTHNKELGSLCDCLYTLSDGVLRAGT